MQLLGTVPGWSDIRPRRPNGGPDGGRDIEATYQGVFSAFGAVGFQNSVSDSPEDKRNAKQKFKDDVAAAKLAKPELTHFVFFTNVDLTPGEVEELVAFGKQQGLLLVEVFYRERIRAMLDCPSGFAFRFQFLDIEMSKEEQTTFFHSYQSQLEAMIARGFDFTLGQLSRNEFFQRLRRGVQQIELLVQLKGPTPAADLVPFRAWAEITSRKTGTHRFTSDFMPVPDPGRSLIVYGQSIPSSVSASSSESGQQSFGIQTLLYAENPREGLGEIVQIGWPVVNSLSFLGQIEERDPYPRIECFDRTSLLIYLTRPLADRAANVFLRIDDWLLFSSPVSAFELHTAWPEYFRGRIGETIDTVPWTYLSPVTMRPSVLMSDSDVVPMRIDFGEFTPKRLGTQHIPTVTGSPPVVGRATPPGPAPP